MCILNVFTLDSLVQLTNVQLFTKEDPVGTGIFIHSSISFRKRFQNLKTNFESIKDTKSCCFLLV